MPARWTATTPAEGRISDGTLVRRVLDGERDAYATLVRRHQGCLFRYARGLGVPPDPAEDLVQDAFIRAYERLGTCEDPDRFEVWLFRILRNGALDYLKDIRRRGIDIDVVPLRDPRARPDRCAERSELRGAIGEGLAQLPEELRDAFLMKHLEGLSYEEMAEVSGASISALKMRVMRARESLRASLAIRGAHVPDVTCVPTRSSVSRIDETARPVTPGRRSERCEP